MKYYTLGYVFPIGILRMHTLYDRVFLFSKENRIIMARCGMHMANFFMRKIENIWTEFWKLSTNMWKTNHVVSHFQEKWRNVVMPCYVGKDRQEFTLSVPLSDNVWAKRTMYHNEISIHRIQEFTIFSQISEKMCTQNFFGVHAVLLCLNDSKR